MDRVRNYSIIFYRINHAWWHKFLIGFNHCVLYHHKASITLNPLVDHLEINNLAPPWEAEKISALDIKIKLTHKNQLIGIKPQTCATLIQYICGFNVNAIRVQKLYDILTRENTSWLRKKGILEVKKWEQ